MLTFLMTDGEKKIKGVEYEAMKNITENELMPGTKIELIGPIRFVNQILFLNEKNVRILGGKVDDLTSVDYLIRAIQNEM